MPCNSALRTRGSDLRLIDEKERGLHGHHRHNLFHGNKFRRFGQRKPTNLAVNERLDVPNGPQIAQLVVICLHLKDFLHQHDDLHHGQ